MFVCWAAKGGSGATVVSCGLAMQLARHHGACTLIDLAGDAPAALGLSPDSVLGAADWLGSPTATAGALQQLAVAADNSLRVIPRGRQEITVDGPTSRRLRAGAAAFAGSVVIDAGTGSPADELLDGATSLLVTRACFVSLRRAAITAARIDGVVLLNEPGRALTSRDVEHALSAPVLAEVAYDPAVARAVDAGLMLARLPRPMAASLRRLVA
jgi:hypothetical protein